MGKLIERCPKCGKVLGEEDKVCPRCGKSLKEGCSGCSILLVCGLIALGICIAAVFSTDRPQGGAVPGPAAPGADPVTHAGDEVILTMGGPEVVLLSNPSDPNAWSEMLAARDRKDSKWTLELMRSGKVFMVPGGTHARVVDTSIASRLVRVQDGEAAGKEGWVQVEFVRKR